MPVASYRPPPSPRLVFALKLAFVVIAGLVAFAVAWPGMPNGG